MKDIKKQTNQRDKNSPKERDLKALIREGKQRVLFMDASDDVDMEEKHLVLFTTMSALKINCLDFVKFYESRCTVK